MSQRLVSEQMKMNLFPEDEAAPANERPDTTSTFSDNLSLPVHRWFHYSAGFSARWVRDLIEREKANGRSRVLDPFAGSGTVLLESESCGVQSAGVEAHPFVARVAQAKLCWRESPRTYLNFALRVLDQAKSEQVQVPDYPPLIKKCFPLPALTSLHSLKVAWEAEANGSPAAELTWLTLASILRDCSPVGTAQWQYVLPGKTKAKAADPYKAFEAKAYAVFDDMTRRHRQIEGPQARLHRDDARECSSIPDGWADLVVTSPPYANNYDYADATRLELSFFGEVAGWGELHSAARQFLVRSCTQHVAALKDDTFKLLHTPLLDPIRAEITVVCEKLGQERDQHGGKKPYDAMIAAYFGDMARVWTALRRVTSEGVLVCFVVGDSAPYGVYVPVESWLGELALAAGFRSYEFEKTRDRNVKWKNRKHRVPLHEGRLWVEG